MLSQNQGVVVGSNHTTDWLIPWWWENYSKHCSLPVAFIDFGMSENIRSYCKDRGDVISIPIIADDVILSFDSKLENLPDFQCRQDYLATRRGWFHKPMAMAASPFDISLWLDLDCEVLQDLSSIFSYVQAEPFIGLVEDVVVEPVLPYTFYNGGVVLYRKDSVIIEKFVQASKERAYDFFGDDNLLCHLLSVLQYPVVEIPYIYNWRLAQGFDPRVAIFHWVGDKGKECIRSFGGVSRIFQA